MQTVFSTAAEWCAWAKGRQLSGHAAEAEAGFRQALAIDPSYPAAIFGFVTVLLDRGDVAGAASAIAPLATAGDNRVEVMWLQSRLALARNDAATARETLTRLLRNTAITSEQRAEALLSLGLALDALGLPGEAFAIAAQGKQLQRRLFAEQAIAREGEVAKLRRVADWITSLRTRPPWLRREVAGSAATHVFLLGFPRSGTTLLENILAAHPLVSALEEAPLLAAAYQAFLSDEEACASLIRLGDEEAAAWAEHYWARVAGHGIDVTGQVFIDKQPAGTLNLPIIARLFPNAKILFALRDPRDVVLSCFRQPFRINAMTYAFTDLVEAARCYDASMTIAGRARTRFSLAWHDVRHEALVDDFIPVLSDVLNFLGLEYHPAMENFATAGHPIRTPSATQVRAGLNRRGLGRWRQYREGMEPAMPILAPWVTRLGY